MIKALIQVVRSAAKEEAAEAPSDGSDNEGGSEKKDKKKKRKGGVTVPEDWPWEEAKKIFEKPDVTPADQLEVRL